VYENKAPVGDLELLKLSKYYLAHVPPHLATVEALLVHAPVSRPDQVPGGLGLQPSTRPARVLHERVTIRHNLSAASNSTFISNTLVHNKVGVLLITSFFHNINDPNLLRTGRSVAGEHHQSDGSEVAAQLRSHPQSAQ
jgi:hypothetical protein